MLKVVVGCVIDVLIDGIKDVLCEGGLVMLVGFGMFFVGK